MQDLGYIYTKNVVIVYLKLKFDCTSHIFIY